MPDGGFVIVWTTKGWLQGNRDIVAQRYGPNLEVIKEPFVVNTHTNREQANPSISALTGGGYMIAWQSYQQDEEDYGVFAQMFDENDDPVGEEFMVNAVEIGDQTTPFVGNLTDGGFVICFTADGQSALDIFAQRYHANGSKFGEAK